MNVWGYQIQNNSKWNPGLSVEILGSFQEELETEFPQSLKNFYLTMNGLDKLGINVGDGSESPNYHPTFYSYPNDTEIIKSQINWVHEANEFKERPNHQNTIPFVFPFFGHRFLVFDNNEQVLSMYGNDIIAWADNLSKAIWKDILYHRDDLLANDNFKPIKFWLE